MSALEGVDFFNNDVIRGKALRKQSHFMTYRIYSTLSCSPQYVVGFGLIFDIWENSLRTKLTDFGVFPLLRYINSANSVIGLILCCVVMFNFVLCEFCDTSELFCSDDLISLRARRVNVRFVRVLGRGKRIF